LTFVSSGQLTYQFDNGSDVGTWSVKVTNPNGQSSGTVSFSVTPSGPVLSNVSPSTYPALDENHALTLTERNFVSGATLTFPAPGALPTRRSSDLLTFVSSGQLTYQFDNGSDVGTWSVKVTNPNGQSSGTVSFSVTASGPVLSNVSPSTY